MSKGVIRASSGSVMARQLTQAKGARVVDPREPSKVSGAQRIWNEIVEMKKKRKALVAAIKKGSV